MSFAIALVLGFVTGALCAGVVCAIVVRRTRIALERQVVQRIGPVLERRAAALGVAVPSSPEVGVDPKNGELVLRTEDALTRMFRLAETIDNHEQSQLGFLDTIRVSKEEVSAQLVENTRRRSNA